MGEGIHRDEAADRRMAETPQLARYLPWLLLYPLRGVALVTLLMLSGMMWLGMQSIFGIALLAISTPWAFQYAEAVIDESAKGRGAPPRFGGDMIFLGYNWGALRPLVGVAFVFSCWRFAREYGQGAELLALAAGTFLFPAFMLTVAIENSLLSAVNPVKLVQAIVGVGIVYPVVCLILAAAACAVVLLAGTGTQFLAVFLSIYLWLMTFHLLGYIAYHRAPQLGFLVKEPAPTDESRAMERQSDRLAATLRNVDAALAARDLDGAGRALTADPGGPADARQYHEELFEQVQHQRRRNLALVHLQGQRLIGVLVREKRLARALDVAETCFDAHRDFQPAAPAEAVLLAEAALGAKRGGLFERLTHDAAARHKGTPAAVSLQFLAVRYFYEQKRDEARAKELLQPLLAQTAHPQHRQIKAFAKAAGLG